MDWRWLSKINIKVPIFIILFLIMSGIMYFFVNKHFKYKTKTTVSSLDSSNIPEVEWFICARLDSLYDRSRRFSSKLGYRINETLDFTGLYLNAIQLNNHSQPFIRNIDKCWQLYNVPPIGHFSFTFHTRNPLEQSLSIFRDIKSKYAIHSNRYLYLAVIGRGRFIGPYSYYSFRNSSMMRDAESILYSARLEFPYDTNCMDYNVTKRFCFSSCWMRIFNVEKCLNECRKEDCRGIQRDYHNQYRNIGNVYSMDFSSEGNFIIKSRPSGTLNDLILLMMGVIVVFFGISVCSAVNNAIDIAGHEYQKRFPIADDGQTSDRIKKGVLAVLIILAIGFFMVHGYWFYHRKVNTNAYFGPAKYDDPIMITPMTIRLCYDHNVTADNLKFNQLNRMTKRFDEAFLIHADNFQYLNVGFVRNQKCFFGRINISQSSENTTEIIQIQSLSSDPFYYSSSIGYSLPIGQDQIRVDGSSSYKVDISSFSYHSSFTNCSKYSEFGGLKEECYRSCIEGIFFKVFGQLPLEVMILDGSNSTLTNAKIPMNISHQCRYKCRSSSCDSSMVLYRKSVESVASTKPKLTIVREGSAKLVEQLDSRGIGEEIVFDAIPFTVLPGTSVRMTAQLMEWCSDFYVNAFTFSGMAFHAAQLSLQYFSYKVHTKVSIGFADKIDIPCFTIFVHKINNHPNTNDPFDSTCTNYSADMINRLLIAKSSNYNYEEITTRQLWNYTIRYESDKFQAMSINMDSIRKSWPSFWSQPEHVAFQIHFSKLFRKCIMDDERFQTSISLHECNAILPDFKSATAVQLRNSDIGYNVAVVKRLSVPYGTFCHSDKNADAGWQSCASSNLINFVPQSGSGKQIVTDCSIRNSLWPPCNTKSYSITQYRRRRPELNHHVSFYGPIRETSTEYMAMMPLPTFIVYLLSMFGIWFGINLFSSFALLTKYCPKVSRGTRNEIDQPSDSHDDDDQSRVFGYGSIRPEPGMIFVMRRLDGRDDDSVEGIIASENI